MAFTYKRIITYFFRGLLFVVPIALTIYVIYLIIQFLDGILPIPIPGLGILIMLAFITFIGFLASIFITKPLFDVFEKWVFKLPLINILYTSIKDLMSAFVGDKKKFNTPVIVKLSEGMSRLGFITQDDLSIIEEENLVAIYFPHSYNFSGNLYLVPRDNVRILKNVKSADIMKLIVSGGVSPLHD
ncbi:DUF502 domain-containing protein [Aquiflexum gelatinilyticum]|jgi:uncharacterized membrane protein|uniref:DUF502 domain-containing protein n=1 Tax=Aquiflexum gelatinilyticum TaxID=2961943 RepID=A0A9X2T074_9BACT|nr:DUF502 domain-containing protein [Aquiflexum gelatinilyticum]MCR9017344.1 DUF502 domain-containing protein [Aquiflexum gelatinilyticum]MCS4434854.1 DUF502 domain-containing protein [Aquiflexum gelatinilyticum]